jgi:hypothetical protein
MTSVETKVAESPAYWTHEVAAFPGPVAQFRMAQLIDLDDRLYENARVVYRFLIGWYHDGYGDALLSMRHVSKVMRARAPEGATILSHSVVQRAVTALLDTGWVVRTHKGRGKGKGASRFMPVLNVLELAGQGKFPEPSHSGGTVQPSRSNGTVVSRSNGTVEHEPSHSNGTKTLLLDPVIDPGTGNSNEVTRGDAAAGLAPAAPAGFERIWNAYGKLGNKATSRVEWAKLIDPDVDHIADRASSWAASAHPGRKRMPLEKWLAAEKYDEADRRVEPKPEVKSADPEPANDDVPDNEPQRWPAGEFAGQFVDSQVSEETGELIVTMFFRIDAPGQHYGKVQEHRFWLRAMVRSYQDDGQAMMRNICDALGLRDVDDTDLLLGKRLVAVADGDAVTYRPVDIAEAA